MNFHEGEYFDWIKNFLQKGLLYILSETVKHIHVEHLVIYFYIVSKSVKWFNRFTSFSANWTWIDWHWQKPHFPQEILWSIQQDRFSFWQPNNMKLSFIQLSLIISNLQDVFGMYSTILNILQNNCTAFT